MSLSDGKLKDNAITEICGDRRLGSRYAMDLPLQYKIVRGAKLLGTGRGHTLDLSSHGIAFTADGPLRCGVSVQLSIEWPMLLGERCALKLVAYGRVVRSDAHAAAIRTETREFHTRAVARLEAPPAMLHPHPMAGAKRASAAAELA